MKKKNGNMKTKTLKNVILLMIKSKLLNNLDF